MYEFHSKRTPFYISRPIRRKRYLSELDTRIKEKRFHILEEKTEF